MAARNKLIGGMLLLTIMGVLLMVPPLVYVFDQPLAHMGVPQIVLYLFILWLVLIVGTALLTHALPSEAPDSEPADGEH